MSHATSTERLLAMAVGLALVAVACTSTPPVSTPTAAPTDGQPTTTPQAGTPQAPTEAPQSPPEGRIQIEWFVGLGTGENEEQIPVEEAVVADFNALQDRIQLTLTVVDNTEAQNTLTTRIAAGDAPDIIGPVGIRGLQAFGDQLLDIGPYIGDVDLSEIPQELIDVYNVDGRQIGIPMAVYPSFFYYNKALFDEANLPYPPHQVGEQYQAQDWTWETVRQLAMQLTVDASGNDATSADFDPENIVQYGLDAQWTENDARAWATVFGGSGSVLAADDQTAQWPDNWRQGLTYFYNGIWQDHFIPNGTAVQAMADGNTFQSGLVAMDVVHQWYVCCVYPGEGEPAVTDWDIAVLPTGPDGSITSKLHADTIAIMSSTPHPEESFEVLSYLAQQPELVQIWGAMPAIESQRADFFASLDERFAPLQIDWNVSSQMLDYPDNPSHEAFMPDFPRADSANKDFGSRLWNTPGLELEAEFDAHVQLLQGIFDQAP